MGSCYYVIIICIISRGDTHNDSEDEDVDDDAPNDAVNDAVNDYGASSVAAM